MLEFCVELDQRMFGNFLISCLKPLSSNFNLKGSDNAIDSLEPPVYFLILAAALCGTPSLYEPRHLLKNLASPSLKHSYRLINFELRESLLKKMYEIYRIFSYYVH